MFNMRNLFFLSLFALVAFVSCNNETQTQQTEIKDTIVEEKVVDRNTQYRLPSPVEFFMFMKDEKAKFNKKSLNDVSKKSSYNTTSQKALNFGVYAADLAYCTVFGQNQETFNYFSTCKQVADELGLIQGFDEKMAKRIDQNINNSDSLYQITTDGYWEAVTYLEEQDKSNLLPYILIGSWVESCYIALNSVQRFKADDPIVLRVAEQQLLLENLIDHLNSLGEVEALKDIISKLTDLQSSFDLLYDNSEDVIITQEQYNEISAKIRTLRKEIVS